MNSRRQRCSYKQPASKGVRQQILPAHCSQRRRTAATPAAPVMPDTIGYKQTGRACTGQRGVGPVGMQPHSAGGGPGAKQTGGLIAGWRERSTCSCPSTLFPVIFITGNRAIGLYQGLLRQIQANHGLAANTPARPVSACGSWLCQFRRVCCAWSPALRPAWDEYQWYGQSLPW